MTSKSHVSVTCYEGRSETEDESSNTAEYIFLDEVGCAEFFIETNNFCDQ